MQLKIQIIMYSIFNFLYKSIPFFLLPVLTSELTEKDYATEFHLQNFVVDIYQKRNGSFWILDFSPFGLPTNSLYFSWEELKNNNFDYIEFRWNDGLRYSSKKENNLI